VIELGADFGIVHHDYGDTGEDEPLVAGLPALAANPAQRARDALGFSYALDDLRVLPDLARRLRMLAHDLLDALGEPWPR
jgi:hypothetical protein